MSDNPYKPPVTSAAPPMEAAKLGAPETLPPLDSHAIEEARRALRAHCADAAALAVDREAEGALFRLPTWIILGLGLAGVGASVVGFTIGIKLLGILAAVFGGLFLFVSIFLVIADLLVGRRASVNDARSAMKRWLRAAKSGHAGYLFAALAPTARAGRAQMPRMEPSEDVRSVPVASPLALKAYLKGWARPDNKWVRWLAIKEVTLVEQPAADLARVRIRLGLACWPMWANIVSAVAFILVRLIGIIVALVLYYTLRKTRTLEAEKLLMRGDDGLWYLLDADLRR